MYSDLNTITITGNLGRDPETRHTPQGTKVVSFSLASSRNFKRGEEWKQETTWIDVKVFGPRGDAAEKLAKGEKVAVTGALRLESWTDDDGGKHSRHVVVAAKMQRFASGKPQAATPDEEAGGEEE